MLALLISTGVLYQQGYLFWDEPETNPNPKLIKFIVGSIASLAAEGIQIFIATHSLYLLRELEMLSEMERHAGLVSRFFALKSEGGVVMLEQGDRINDLQTIVSLDEELMQSDRFLKLN